MAYTPKKTTGQKAPSHMAKSADEATMKVAAKKKPTTKKTATRSSSAKTTKTTTKSAAKTPAKKTAATTTVKKRATSPKTTKAPAVKKTEVIPNISEPVAVPSIDENKPAQKHADDSKKKKSKIISRILLIIAALLFIAGGYMLWDSLHQYADQNANNEKLAGYSKVSDDASKPPVVDWASLKAVNKDVCAWIQIPSTTVNYPVYKGRTNDTYLRTNAYGKYSLGGQVFMDCDNSGPDMEDEQTLVYGHHLKDGSMFAQVDHFNDQAFMDSINTVWWVTEKANYELTPVFAYEVQETDLSVRKFKWGDKDAFHNYLMEKLSGASAKKADAEDLINNSDGVISLVTCNYDNGHGRTIVVCTPKPKKADVKS